MTDRRISFILFLFFFFFHLLFLGDYASEAFYSSDEVFYFRLTQSLVEDRSLEIEPYLGFSHSKYLPGQSVAGIPLYLVGRLLGALFSPLQSSPLWLLTILHLTNVIIGAFICVVFYRFGRDLGYGKPACLAGTLTLGLATTFFPYSKQYFADPLVALMMLCGVRYLYLSSKGRPGAGLLAGLFFGYAVFTKMDTALLIIPLLVCFLALFPKPRILKHYLVFMLGLAPFALLILVYNHFNYGSAFNPGYERQGFASPFVSGAYGLLLSPGRGLFLFSPPVLLLFFGWSGFRKKFPGVFIICLVLLVARITILAKWFSWQGGWCWGPRLLLPVIPLMLLPGLEVFENWQWKKTPVRLLVLGLLASGLYIQFIGATVSPNKYNNDIWGMLPGGVSEFLFIPQLSSLKGNWFLLCRGKLDLLWVRIMKGTGLGGSILFALNLGAAFFLLGVILKEIGLGKPGWRQRFIPQATRLIVPSIIILLVIFISFVIFKGQGLSTLRYTYIEESRIPGEPAVPRIFRGYLHAPMGGEYKFALKVRGTYAIRLDGKILLKNQEDLPQHWDYAHVELVKGFHFIEGAYLPRADSDIALMHLYWTIPDNARYKSIIGPLYLYHEPPGAFGRLLLFIAAFRTWIVLLIILVFWIRSRRP